MFEKVSQEIVSKYVYDIRIEYQDFINISNVEFDRCRTYFDNFI